MPGIASFLVGLLFGLGLVVSGMINPEKIIGFLDVAGQWDPTLLFVMAGAFAASFAGFRIVLTRKKPILSGAFSLPTKTVIDRPLIIGAALFGVGWGLSGFCPGPGVTALSLGAIEPVIFVAAMVAGMVAHNVYAKMRA
ncbi:MAG: DUF6691 family protein [Parvularculaceae bacterium]